MANPTYSRGHSLTIPRAGRGVGKAIGGNVGGSPETLAIIAFIDSCIAACGHYRNRLGSDGNARVHGKHEREGQHERCDFEICNGTQHHVLGCYFSCPYDGFL